MERAQLSDVVVDQRLAAVEAELGDQLEDPDPRQPRVRAQQPLNLLPRAIQRRRTNPTYDRRQQQTLLTASVTHVATASTTSGAAPC
jgi:hypothetical protein